MKIVYLSNFFNHHQKPLADFLYESTGQEYLFVETMSLPQDKIKLGYQKYDCPYVERLTKVNSSKIQCIIDQAEVVICGEAPLRLIRTRVNQGKLTFRDQERLYKSYSRYLKLPVHFLNSFIINKCYLLCASAYCTKDHIITGFKENKCFKWGYFPIVKRYADISSLIDNKEKNSILWAGRLIKWKHPELPILIVLKLKENGVNVNLNIIGIGPMFSQLKKMVSKLGLDDRVHFLGAMSPDRVRLEMEKSQVYLFTSDRGEGWGAVLNEAMNSACAVIASHAIGAVPFMIQNNYNGLIYKDQNLQDLYNKILYVIKNNNFSKEISLNAYMSMVKFWSAEVAGKNLLMLIQAILQGNNNPIIEGPCSPAPRLSDHWIYKLK